MHSAEISSGIPAAYLGQCAILMETSRAISFLGFNFRRFTTRRGAMTAVNPRDSFTFAAKVFQFSAGDRVHQQFRLFFPVNS